MSIFQTIGTILIWFFLLFMTLFSYLIIQLINWGPRLILLAVVVFVVLSLAGCGPRDKRIEIKERCPTTDLWYISSNGFPRKIYDCSGIEFVNDWERAVGKN